MNPVAALFIFPIWWIALAAGRQLNRWLCPPVASENVLAIERFAFGSATGFALASLGMLALGLLHLFYILPVFCLFLCLAVFGLREMLFCIRETASGIRSIPRLGARWIFWILIVLVALGALGGCFVPPVSSEWDSLSYHLADPKIYLAAHRVFYIPWESHSNFAFNMEMLYSIGMMARSMALAKLFSFALGAMGAIGVYCLARHVTPAERGMAFVPALALLVYITLPLAFWEAGTAYVDLAATSFATLALLAMAIAVQTGERRFYLLAGVLLGGMLGIKATALITIALYALGIAVYFWPKRVFRSAALWNAFGMGVVAVLVGSPWYIKSWLYTGNPVYPFAYTLFGGRYWDQANTVAYNAAQHNFGMGHKLSDLILAPWNLTMYLVPGHIPPQTFVQPFNDYQTVMSSLSPLFLICAIAALALPLAAPRGIRLLTGYCVLSLVVWFFLTQQVRYLLPVAPVLCIVAAWTISRLAAYSVVSRITAAVACAASLLFNCAMIAGQAQQQWPIALAPASVQQTYIAAGLSTYPAMQFINNRTAANAKVVCYGEPRTLYLDRSHLWGEPGHSLLIPYDRLKTADALRAWLVARGYTTILINAVFFKLQPSANNWSGMVTRMTFGSGVPPIYADQRRGVYVFELH